MRRFRASRGEGKIGCVVWFAIVALITYALVQIVPVKMADSRFEDFLNEEAGFGSIKSIPQIEKEILAKAQELRIPVTKDNLTINRSRESILVETHYELVINFFGGAYKYVWKRDHVVRRPLFAV
jgi:hypothetical protein